MFDLQSVYADLAKGVWRQPWLAAAVVPVLRRLMCERRINDFLLEHGDLPPRRFIEEVLRYLQVQYRVKLIRDARLPTSGRVLVLANHPLGGLDGLALLHAALSVRDDVKIVVNHLLTGITPLAGHMIAVKNWRRDYPRQAVQAIVSALHHDEMIILFPAGEVSRFRDGRVQDGEWGKACLTLAKRCHAPLLPVYIEGRNSRLFYALDRLLPAASTALLPRELWSGQGRHLELIVGNLLPIEMFARLPVSDQQTMRLLRRHVYQMPTGEQTVFTPPQPIAEAAPAHIVQEAVDHALMLGDVGDDSRAFLFEGHGNSVLLQEIGRLREISFRQVEEGSGLACDVDAYDSYYRHIVLWDEVGQAIMGAYRLFPSAEVLQGKGIEALYTARLYDYGGDRQWLGQAVELGRGFVVPQYWNSRALDKMWQGIGAFCARHPQIRYLFGGVSVSKRYPKEAVECLIALYSTYMPNHSFAVQAKNPYRMSSDSQARWAAFYAGMDFAAAEAAAKKYLKMMDLSIPPLFKHYSHLCEEGGVSFGDFCVDPEFGFSIDAWVIVDLQRLRAKKYARYIAPYTAASSAAMPTAAATAAPAKQQA